LNDPLVLGAVFSTVLFVLFLAYGTWQFVSPTRTAADRLAEFTGGPGGDSAFPTRLNALTRQAARLAAGSETDIATIRRWLVQAGFRSKTAPEVYSASRTVGLVFGALSAFLLLSLLKKTTMLWLASGCMVGASVGYYAPYLYVQNALQKRRERILAGFPDALDLLVSAVEAGLGLDSAFRRVADEMEISAPELAMELQLVSHEVMAGVPRVEAMRHLDERIGLDEVGWLVNVLVQAERFGSSVARALRVHSEHIRIKRMQRAETKAAQVSPKLTIVMIIFILPTLLIILLGPAAISMKNILVPTAASKGIGQ
jgi:tight adherence protein C